MDNKFYVIIAGTRTFSNYDLFCEKCDLFLSNHSNITIVSGGAKGADTFARHYAKENNIDFIEIPANWNKYGKRAGFVRNEEMHKYISQFDHRGCICFWDGASKGTQHNFGLCKRFNTPLRVVQF